jgi:hypothetical protein
VRVPASAMGAKVRRMPARAIKVAIFLVTSDSLVMVSSFSVPSEGVIIDKVSVRRFHYFLLRYDATVFWW